MTRIVSYFSAGVPSAVATKLAIASGVDVTIYNFEIKEEHPDNKRFLADCQDWFGQEIVTVGNDKFGRSAHKVIRDTKYLVGPKGARCTGELKKAMRWEVGQPTDTIVMGYTSILQGARITTTRPDTTDQRIKATDTKITKALR